MNSIDPAGGIGFHRSHTLTWRLWEILFLLRQFDINMSLGSMLLHGAASLEMPSFVASIGLAI